MQIMMPVPADAPEPDYGNASRAYCYRNSQGEPLFDVVRYDDGKGGKSFRPFTCWQRDDGALQWRYKAPPEPRPLYGLELLTQKPAAPVLLVEGEKACEAARELFPAYACVTSMGGSNAAQKADFSPLQGRKVTIWPDADEAGAKYTRDCISLLFSIGVAGCALINLPPDLPKGWDLAEQVSDRYPIDWLTQQLENATQVHPQDIALASELEVTCFDDVQIEPIKWLWKDRIALGKLTVLAGHPGLGKSQLTALLGAKISTGGPWPNGEGRAPLGRVLFLSAEDDPADTIKPRLLAAGADVSRCYMLEAVKVGEAAGMTRSFSLEQDADRLEKELQRLKDVAMVVIDPISAYYGNVDSHNNADIRGLLAPFNTLASKYGVALLAISHLNKSTSQEPISRVIGSMGLTAAARAVYYIVKDEKDENIRHFVPVKNNIGNDYDGFSYFINTVEVAEGISSSRIIWVDGTKSAKEVLYPTADEKAGATNGAGDFLLEMLQDGPKPASEIFEAAEGNGYTKSTVQRAKQRLGIKASKQGMTGGWVWTLPDNKITTNNRDEGAEDAEGASP